MGNQIKKKLKIEGTTLPLPVGKSVQIWFVSVVWIKMDCGLEMCVHSKQHWKVTLMLWKTPEINVDQKIKINLRFERTS